MSLNLLCNGCGGEIEYEAGNQSLKCPYCGAINEIAKPENRVSDHVEKVIPLTVKKQDLENRVYEYMASGNYTPDDMIEEAKIINRQFFYVPAYKFQVEFEATWTASFGYDRQEHYTEYVSVTKWTGQGANRRGYTVQEPQTRTRTVTDWRPANGTDTGVFFVAEYAGNKLHESELRPTDLVKFTAIEGKMTDFNPSFLQGVETENFCISESNSFASLKNETNSIIERSVKNHGQGDRQKDWHWSATMSHSSKTVYVPICHAVFDYKGAEYQVWIDGIGSNEIIADALPEDKEKKQEVYKGFIPVIVGLSSLIATSYFWVFTWIGIGFVSAVGSYALLRRYSLIGYSKKIRDSLLTQMKASSNAMNDLSDDERNKLAIAFQRPKKPFFAKIHRDKLILPCLSFLAILGVTIPSYDASHLSRSRITEVVPVVKEVVPVVKEVAPVVEEVAPASKDTNKNKSSNDTISGIWDGEMQEGIGEVSMKITPAQTVYNIVLDAVTNNGSCIGNISGIGTLKGKHMVFTQKPGEEPCKINIVFDGETAILTEEQCMYYHGSACTFSGVVEKGDN
ncbi:hypothetical protein SJPD1_2696 [Sulfurospirillum diekertiae]|uniref:DUF4178 domain-containing protein n=1 Tax=Sulfurospirillum diekertiae TaxID=1854492 RepID=A0A290HHA6_9BACT|nr:hypothetical protein [Sulfurospirillum diekertiae]ATB70785.1 hypothetical protein SJPD1_2696 [Sulfurospirillum diekertiae]